MDELEMTSGSGLHDEILFGNSTGRPLFTIANILKPVDNTTRNIIDNMKD
jgi:hypothetical protein